MRKLTLLVFIFIVCFSCTRSRRHTNLYQTESKGFPFLISNGKVGTISIGDGIDTSLKNLTLWFEVKQDSVPVCEGCNKFFPIYRIYYRKENQYIFSIEPGTDDNNKDKVSRIITSYTLFKTEDDGIQVGMSVKDIKRKYEITEVDNSGETGIHIFVKGFNGSFGMEMPKSDEWFRFTPTSIPDSLRITEIVIT